MNETGFLYIATGEKFVREALRSVASLRAHMPSARTCCFTDAPERVREHFDLVERIEKPYRNFFEKIPPLSRTPFERTIFVDTDTVFAAPMLDVFDVLERFDLAAAPDPFWCEIPRVPAAFQQLNTGLIAYRNNAKVRQFFTEWFDDYEKGFTAAGAPRHMHDQAVFQRRLFYSDLRIYVLAPEYNFRLTCPQLARIWAPVRMLHGRHTDLADLGRRVNAQHDVRIVWPNAQHLVRSNMFLVSRAGDAILRAATALPKFAVKAALDAQRWIRRPAKPVRVPAPAAAPAAAGG
ncbi:hypothetical protein [Opitutus terrae]|nr:hypothetical protein [Opitutus terrae]